MNISLYGRFTSRQAFFSLLGRAAWGSERAAPRNLDGLADLLRETQLVSVSVGGSWRIDADSTEDIAVVFSDCGVSLRLPTEG